MSFHLLQKTYRIMGAVTFSSPHKKKQLLIASVAQIELHELCGQDIKYARICHNITVVETKHIYFTFCLDSIRVV